MKTILPWLLATAFLVAAVYLYFQKNEAEHRLAIAVAKAAALEQKAETTDSPESMVLPPDTTTLVPPGGAAFVDELGSLSESDLNRLRRKGLQNPEADLRNDLNRSQSKLIPVKGTMGGTMAIRDSRILNGRYVLAYYEDGHNGGNLLLKYEVNNGSITWTVLDHSRL